MLIETDTYRVRPGERVRLADIDPCDTGDFDGDKADGKRLHRRLASRLGELQELLYADGRHRLLVVLQAMDTGGKDGAIRSVFRGVNPAGVRVAAFKHPSEEDLAHDYLWRVHPEVPGNGQITIFNRSHYEDVLVVRVKNLVPEERWARRYRHLVEFERMLADEGTTIVKLFLHISKEEQRQRLQARLDDPTKHWKFSVGDLAERDRWEAYRSAYEDMLHRTSAEYAPWYVVPADRKWFRDLVVSSVVIRTLESLGLRHPLVDDLTDVVIP